MKPFSALYFIKENKSRCLLLMFMIFLSFGVYLGGLYVTNPLDNWDLPMAYYDKLVSVFGDDNGEEGYKRFIEQASVDDEVKVIELGTYNGIKWNSIMGFESGTCTFTFRSVEDFKVYCDHMGIECDFANLKSGSMIMSEKFANNKGFALGEKVDKNSEYNIYGEFTLDAITDEDGYMAYFITNKEDILQSAILLGNGKEIYDYAYELQGILEDESDVIIHPGFRETVESEFATFDIIYLFIVVLLSIILAVTINAAFVGMYQKRELEFSVYRAIGISKKRIIGKVAGELLLIDVIALIVGAAIAMVGLYLFNNMILYPIGKYLRYFEPLAFVNLIFCNVIIIVPLIISRCRRLLKADICEY